MTCHSTLILNNLSRTVSDKSFLAPSEAFSYKKFYLLTKEQALKVLMRNKHHYSWVLEPSSTLAPVTVIVATIQTFVLVGSWERGDCGYYNALPNKNVRTVN